MKLVMPGGGGFCGRLLVRYFAARGDEVIVLSRTPTETIDGARVLSWDGVTAGSWTECLEGAGAVINLAGRTVNSRYHADNCTQIYASRLDSTRVLGAAIAACQAPPPVWLNAASATIYRDAYDRPMDEATGELGKGFSVDVCRRWEQAFFDAPTPGTRKVALRSAMVFAPGRGGVWDAFAGLAKFGLAGSMAGGRQFVSWIHGEDFCRSVEFLLEKKALAGPVNLAAPNPLPNAAFLAALRKALGVPFGLPTARWMLVVGAWLRQTETELLLKSRRAVPGRLLEAGFAFRFPDWAAAAQDLARK